MPTTNSITATMRTKFRKNQEHGSTLIRCPCFESRLVHARQVWSGEGGRNVGQAPATYLNKIQRAISSRDCSRQLAVNHTYPHAERAHELRSELSTDTMASPDSPTTSIQISADGMEIGNLETSIPK